MVMDFMECLTKEINESLGLPVKMVMGYTDVSESLVIYPLPGSKITQVYMDGTTDQSLNYEVVMKSKLQSRVNATLWKLQNKLESLSELNSNNDSFLFEEITIPSKPFISNADEQGWVVFSLELKVNITVLK